MKARYFVVAALTVLVSSAAVSQEVVEQSDIGRRVVGEGYPFVIPQSLVDEMRAKREQIAAVGYAEKDSPLTRAEHILARMDQQRRSSEVRRNGRAEAGDLDYVEVSEFDVPSLGFKIAVVPTTVLTLESQGYVLQANKHVVKQIFTGTSLGTLLVDEYIDAKLYSDSQPDLFVVGQPAWRSTIKYPGDKWSTSIGVQVDSGRLLIATVDRRFEGPAGQSFVDLLESLVLSTY